MKLAVLLNDDMAGKLTKFFTGCYAHHTCWVDEEAGLVYDQSFLMRRRYWPKPSYSEEDIYMFDFPLVTREYLEERLTRDNTIYGWRDYALFGFKWLYKLIGKPVPNINGKICSETNNEDLVVCGYETPWRLEDAPPSPCELLKWLINTHKLENIKFIKGTKK